MPGTATKLSPMFSRRPASSSPAVRASLAFATAAATALGVVGAPVTASAATPTIAQGNRLIVGSNYCTAGYNEPAAVDSGASATAGQTFVAAHCGNDGDGVYLPSDRATRLGTFHPSAAYDPATRANDWGVITWDVPVTLGTNDDSGTVPGATDAAAALARVNQLTSGDQVCMRATTAAAPRCGAFIGASGSSFFAEDLGVVPGDSGAALWSPTAGFLGVVSGTNTVTDPSDGSAVPSTRGSILADGPALSLADVAQMLTDHYGFYVPPADAAPDASSASSGSADSGSAGTGAWIGGTLGIVALIAAVFALLGQVQNGAWPLPTRF